MKDIPTSIPVSHQAYAGMFKIIGEFGRLLIETDKKDIGQFRNEHHPSFWHHWQIGALMVFMEHAAGSILIPKK